MNNDNKMTNDNKYNFIPELGITYLAKNLIDKMSLTDLLNKKRDMLLAISENGMRHNYNHSRTHNEIEQSIKRSRAIVAYVNKVIEKKRNKGGRRTRRNKSKKSKKSMRRR